MKNFFLKTFLKILIASIMISCSTIPDISNTYSWDDGPWITIKSDPETSIVISWLTKKKEPTIIFWGESEDKLERIILDKRLRSLHHASFIDLKPDSKYYYSINAHLQTGTNKKIFSFKTFSGNNQDLKFTIIGDLQPINRLTRSTNRIIADSIKKEKPDFVVQLGDISENGGINFFWHYVLENLPVYASEIPFMGIAGNHDYYWSGNHNFRKLFPYPYKSAKGLYYSQDFENAHLIYLDCYDDNMQMSEEQKIWVENDLNKAVENGKKWIFIFLHDTLITTGVAQSNWEIQKWLIPLADEYQVDAVFFGHSHNYEHWLFNYGSNSLIYDKNSSFSGNPVHYFCSGGGGARLGYNYNLLDKESSTFFYPWYNTIKDSYIDKEVVRSKWNENIYIDHKDNPFYGAPPEGKHYYHLPSKESYSTDNKLYGFTYGEQTLHYINVEIYGTNNENCRISAHYPNGDLLTGPENKNPQLWELSK